LALSIFRSIETRLPIFRSTNTGISAVVNPKGDITQTTAMNQPVVMDAQIEIRKPPQTLMMLLGDWFAWPAIIAGSIILWWVLRKRSFA